MPRPRSEKTGPAVNLRLGDALIARVKEAARITGKSEADVIREAMDLGLTDWELTGFQSAAIVAQAAITAREKASRSKEIAMLSEPKKKNDPDRTTDEAPPSARYGAKKSKCAIAPSLKTDFFVVTRKG